MKYQRKGFTLIELLVVIVIIGILAGLTTATYKSSLKKAKTAKLIAEMAQIERQMKGCYDESVSGCTFSTNTCSTLGWSTAHSSATPSVVPADCGESDGGFPTGGSGLTTNCHQEIGWEDARSICEGMGSRLCTIDELSNQIVADTGCGHDARMVWTMSACEDGFKVILGDSVDYGTSVEYCENDLEATNRRNDITYPAGTTGYDELGVRCCADN